VIFIFVQAGKEEIIFHTELGNETGKKGEVGFTVVEWGGGELASPLL